MTLSPFNNLCVLVKNMEELTEKVYSDISNISTKTLNWFQERVILSPSNEQIDEIKILFFQNLKLHHKPITQLTQSWIEGRQYIIQLNRSEGNIGCCELKSSHRCKNMIFFSIDIQLNS